MGSTADWQSTIGNLRELLRKFADDRVGYGASVALIEGFTDAFEHAENLVGAPVDELEDLLLRAAGDLGSAIGLSFADELPIERLMAAIPLMIETISGVVVFEDCILFWDRFLWQTSVRHERDRAEVYIPAALTALEQQATSSSAMVRKSALYGLQMLKASGRAERVIRRLATDSDDDVRSSAQLILDGGRI